MARIPKNIFWIEMCHPSKKKTITERRKLKEVIKVFITFKKAKLRELTSQSKEKKLIRNKTL